MQVLEHQSWIFIYSLYFLGRFTKSIANPLTMIHFIRVLQAMVELREIEVVQAHPVVAQDLALGYVPLSDFFTLLKIRNEIQTKNQLKIVATFLFRKVLPELDNRVINYTLLISKFSNREEISLLERYPASWKILFLAFLCLYLCRI